MRNFTIITLILIAIISILCSIATPPLIRESVIVPADFNIQEQKQEIQDNIDTNVIHQEQIMEAPKIIQQVNTTKPKTTKPKTTKPQPQKQQTTKTQPKKAEPKVVTKTTQQTTTKPTVKKEETKPAETKPVEQKQDVPKVLTPEEENIVWNKWHSDLQNHCMRELPSPVPLPLLTVVHWQFTVDKFGNISNIKIWSEDSTQNSQAIKLLKPIIVNLQGSDIVKFPEGTKRTMVNFKGSIQKNTKTIYTKPSDYNDVERITR